MANNCLGFHRKHTNPNIIRTHTQNRSLLLSNDENKIYHIYFFYAHKEWYIFSHVIDVEFGDFYLYSSIFVSLIFWLEGLEKGFKWWSWILPSFIISEKKGWLKCFFFQKVNICIAFSVPFYFSFSSLASHRDREYFAMGLSLWKV